MPTRTINTLCSKQVDSNRTCLSLEAAYDPGESRVDVEFVDDLSTEEVITSISQLSNPQVIIWYIGYYGLREAGVQFYKDFLIAPIFKQSTGATFWLVDLTAWGAFKNSWCSIHNFNSCCAEIEGFLDKRVNCIKSAEIFRKMKEISECDLIDYFKTALKRDFISKASKSFPNRNIPIKEIFSDSGSIVADWFDQDASKSYSVFQYLEGCLLVDEIFMREFHTRGVADIQIVFALPNDEIKYYKDKDCSFQKDVAFLISKRCATLNIKNIHLQIKFLAFKYASHPHDRPYNASGKIVKSGTLSYEDVVGHTKNDENRSQEELIYASSLR